MGNADSADFSFSIHSLSWPNNDPRFVEYQNKAFSSLGLHIHHHIEQTRHDLWLQEVYHTSNDEVLLFVDIDCIPLNRQVVFNALNAAFADHSFCGITQSSNHIGDGLHIYAAPAFLAVSKRFSDRLYSVSKTKVDFRINSRSDAAEELTWAADLAAIRYTLLLPTSWEYLPASGQYPWRLGAIRYYGIGTIYEGGIFHLFESRLGSYIDLFIDVANSVVNQNPPTSMSFSSSRANLLLQPNAQASLHLECLRASSDRSARLNKIFGWLPGPLYLMAVRFLYKIYCRLLCF